MGWEEFFALISVPLGAFIVAMLTYAAKKFEGKVSSAVENGAVQKAIGRTVNTALEETIHPRLDKIEAGTWNNSQRLQTLEEHHVGGTGQHFQPPNAMVDASAGSVEVASPVNGTVQGDLAEAEVHVVPGTQPEHPPTAA